MDIKYFRANLEKRHKKNNLRYFVSDKATDEMLLSAEKRIGFTLNQQICLFYKECNGLTVDEPHIKIYSLDELTIDNGKLIFAIIDNEHFLAFDIRAINEAEQWNIINVLNNYVVTLTFASFWSNKLWAWLDKKRKIWEDEGNA